MPSKHKMVDIESNQDILPWLSRHDFRKGVILPPFQAHHQAHLWMQEIKEEVEETQENEDFDINKLYLILKVKMKPRLGPITFISPVIFNITEDSFLDVITQSLFQQKLSSEQKGLNALSKKTGLNNIEDIELLTQLKTF